MANSRLEGRFLARVARRRAGDPDRRRQRNKNVRAAIAAVCAKARSSEACAVNEIDTDEEGQRLCHADDGSIWLVMPDCSPSW